MIAAVRVVLGLAVLLVAAALLGGCGGASMSPTAPASADSSKVAQAPKGSHTVLIVLENHEFGEVIGATDAPYLNKLASQGTLATNFHAITHPSLPNYLALFAGSTFGIEENCSDCLASGTNLATQLAATGKSWRAYMGAMPSVCYAGAAEVGSYAKKHNPFMYFPSVTSDPSLCNQVVPEALLQADLARGRLPAFAWITPDLCRDAHDCTFGSADEYLRRVVPKIRRQLGPDGLLTITFDEGTTNSGCCGGAVGGHIATVLLGPGVRKGFRLRAERSSYSLLATIEDRFGVARLRRAQTAPALSAAFTSG
jgi:hypothetical protein